MVSRWGGTHSDVFEGACPVERKLLLKNFVIVESLSDDGSGAVGQNPTNGHVFGATEKRVREGRNPPVYTGDCEGVLFAYELLGTLLPFTCKVVIGEVVAVEALIGSTIVAIEDGEGGAG